MDRKIRKSDLERYVRWFSKVKVLVIGDIMMDRFIWGKVSRISPEAPVPVVVVDKEEFLLGGAANVVNNIHSLGGKVSICGVVGEDEHAHKIFQLLTEREIETGGIVKEEGRQTTVKTRIIAHQHPHQQQIARIDREMTGHTKITTYRRITHFLTENIDYFDGIIISDYGKGLMTRTLIQTIIQRAKELKKFVMVDPKPKNFPFYKGATLITPNTKEAGEAAGIFITDGSSLRKAGRKLLNKSKCDILIITQGEEGMTIFGTARKPYPVRTVAKNVYDVTGAGDTVIGTLALAWGAGASVEEAAELANYAAGIVVGKIGTATVSQGDLIAEIARRH